MIVCIDAYTCCCYDYPTCKTQWPEVVGMNGAVAAAAIESSDPRLKCVVLQQRRHTRMHNYDCSRVRIWVGHDGTVERVPTVG
ncbi:hypothetical protein ACHQM5_014422 [Ranunculus cassubicifolius]